MTMEENANFIQILEGLGWTEDQINMFILGIAGHFSVDETAGRIDSLKKIKDM